MPTVSRSAATCCGGCKTEDKGAGKIFNAADYFCFMLDDTLGALAMRRFCGSFLVHGGSGNRPTCSSDKIKIQHRGTPSTPSFCLVSCATLLHPSDYGKQLLEAHHSQLMDITKVFARRALKLKVERQGQLLLSCQLKNP